MGLLSYRCIVTINVLWLFLTMQKVCLQYVILVFPDQTHLQLATGNDEHVTSLMPLHIPNTPEGRMFRMFRISNRNWWKCNITDITSNSLSTIGECVFMLSKRKWWKWNITYVTPFSLSTRDKCIFRLSYRKWWKCNITDVTSCSLYQMS